MCFKKKKKSKTILTKLLNRIFVETVSQQYATTPKHKKQISPMIQLNVDLHLNKQRSSDNINHYHQHQKKKSSENSFCKAKVEKQMAETCGADTYRLGSGYRWPRWALCKAGPSTGSSAHQSRAGGSKPAGRGEEGQRVPAHDATRAVFSVQSCPRWTAATVQRLGFV